jgi:hypothetical protein
MISAKPLELKIQQKKNRSKNNWSNFSVAYLEISHRKESENHVCPIATNSKFCAKNLEFRIKFNLIFPSIFTYLVGSVMGV